MNGFWNLVSFEYKKILSKRMVQITLMIAVLLTVLSVLSQLIGSYYINGELYESNYDAIIKDRNYARSLSGELLDTELIMETVGAYAQIGEADVYQATQEYQTTARPYSQIYQTIRTVFNTDSRRFNMEDFQGLTREDAENFYITRHNRLEQNVLKTKMSEQAKARVIEMDTEIKTPLAFSYTDGYISFFIMVNMIMLFASFAMAICVAPLFAGEYTSGADQLILSSRHGKNKLIAAKLFTGFSLAAGISILLMVLLFLLSMAVLGADGANAPLQLYMIFSPYPLTMWQTALLLSITTLLACIMTAAITMLLSAKLKTPFGVIILISILLIVPMFVSVSENNLLLYRLNRLLPMEMGSIWSVTDGIQDVMFGLVLPPYVSLPLFALAFSILLTPFAYRSFKRHQIT